jgi:protein-S-isoprenylcysteine O-methyltransferase Ste14
MMLFLAECPGMRLGLHLLPYSVSRRAHGPGTPFPPTFLFIIGFVVALWVDWQVPWKLGLTGSPVLRAIVGAAAVAVGAAIFWWGISSLARVRTGILLQQPARRLVIAGPYQWTRNPQYVGYVAMYFGAAILANTLWPLVILPAVIALLVLLVITREERYLEGVFGSEYADYRARVKRWI